jgi:hypothetical protein
MDVSGDRTDYLTVNPTISIPGPIYLRVQPIPSVAPLAVDSKCRLTSCNRLVTHFESWVLYQSPFANRLTVA